jgi:hypothetical protein
MVRKSVVALIALLAFVAIPTSAASASTTVTVDAHSGPADFRPLDEGFAGNGFTDSGVTLPPGGHAVITATGTWSCDFFDPNISPGCVGGPDGAPIPPDQDPYFQPNLNAYSLMASLDGGVTWQAVGSGPTIVTGPGHIIFSYNDNNYGDNDGSVSVTISTGLPTSKSECMNGGWANFGSTFKNQGDCVSFVATGGKALPNG